MANISIGLNSAITTAVFALTFILIGVPIWWKTTEVYRYPIPHEECQQLVNLDLRHAIPVKLIVADRSAEQIVLWENLLQLSAESENEHSKPSVVFQWSMSTVSDEEELLIKEHDSIAELDAAFYLADKKDKTTDMFIKSSGEIHILILNQNVFNSTKFTIGKHKLGYILNNSDSKDLANDVFSLVKKIAQVSRLKKLYVSPSTYTGDKKPDKDRMRHLRSATNFDITFSLFVSEPQVLNIQWDIEKAVDAYLHPLLEELSLIYNVNVKSQFLYMTSLPLPRGMTLDENGEYVVHSENLPSIINPAEARLGSDTSLNPNLNFVIYIPTREQTPLRIYDAHGQPVQTNAFLLPQWGGFHFYNCPLPENASLPHTFHLEERIFMEVFLTQFRLLLGLPYMGEINDQKCEVLSSPGISEWELDFLLRKNAQDHLSAAASSLSSLSHLLHSIGNIVIRDDVGGKIYKALSASHQSLQLLSDGLLEAGFLRARTAFIASEEAFFDPSLLALLYFPEDQKYAIYIPLFLPISIPVITSLNRLWKFWKGKQKAKLD